MSLFRMDENSPHMVAEVATADKSGINTSSDKGDEILDPACFYFQRNIVFAEKEDFELRLHLALPAFNDGPFPTRRRPHTISSSSSARGSE